MICVALVYVFFATVKFLHGQVNVTPPTPSNRRSIDRKCDPNLVYYVQEIRPVEHESGKGVVMVCDIKPICERMPTCFYSIKNSCNGPFEYLANVMLLPGAVRSDRRLLHRELCCKYSQSSVRDAIETCHTVDILDRYAFRNGTKSKDTVLDVFHRSARHSSFVVPPNRFKRQLDTAEAKKVDVLVRPIIIHGNKTITTELLVKTIVPLSDGYRVTICTIVSRCSDERREPNDEPGVGAAAAAAGTAGAVNPENRAGAQSNPRNAEGSRETEPSPDGSPGSTGTFPTKFPIQCFAGTSLVETHQGPKQMAALREGDRILAINGALHSASTLVYESVEWFIHHDNETLTKFIELRTESGRAIILSRYHLLPLFNCEQKLQPNSEIAESSLFAHKATVGRCLAVRDHDKHILRLEKIVNIATVTRQGLYSPVTKSGTLVVNGIAVSCFSHVENHDFLRSIFTKYFYYRETLSLFFNWMTSHFSTNDIPLIVRIAAGISSFLDL